MLDRFWYWLSYHIPRQFYYRVVNRAWDDSLMQPGKGIDEITFHDWLIWYRRKYFPMKENLPELRRGE